MIDNIRRKLPLIMWDLRSQSFGFVSYRLKVAAEKVIPFEAKIYKFLNYLFEQSLKLDVDEKCCSCQKTIKSFYMDPSKRCDNCYVKELDKE